MKYLYLPLLILFTCPFIYSQKNGAVLTEFINSTNNEKALVKESVDQTLNGNFLNAILVIDKLISIDDDNPNYYYRMGYLSYHLNKNNQAVIETLLKAVKGKIVKDFDIYTTRKIVSIDAYYFLGSCYLKANQLDSAQKYIERYLENTHKNSSLFNSAELKLIYLKNAKKQLDLYNSDMGDKNIHVTNMGGQINSKYQDYSSVLSPNGLELFYTSKRPWGGDTSIFLINPGTGQYPDDIYRSSYDFDSDSWSRSVRLPFNTAKYNEGVTSSNIKVGSIYIYSDSIGKGNILTAKVNDDGKLGKIENLKIAAVNSNKYWEPSIYISKYHDRIYFSSDRKGGYGGLDIYYCDRIGDSSWSEPVNLGPQINTKYNEDAPVVSANGKYFFYTSNNEKSMGGYDIFYAPITDDGKIEEGFPLKYPINSTSDDIYYKPSNDDLSGFLTSDRPDGSYGDLDIYDIDNNYIGIGNKRIFIASLDMADNEALPEDTYVKLTCLDCETQTPILLKPRKRDGVVQSSIEPCHHYQVEYLQNNEVKNSTEIKTDCDQLLAIYKMPYTYDLKPKPTEPEVAPTHLLLASFKNIFGYNKNKISQKNDELQDIIAKAQQILKENTHARITFEISSSASKVPTRAFKDNHILAQRRADNLQKVILANFEEELIKSGRVSSEIKNVVVDGPEYQKDFKDISKYKPYQFVSFQVYQQ